MTRPAEDRVTDAEPADRQFGRRLASRWGVTAQSDRRRAAIRVSARRLRFFAVTGGRVRLAQVSVPRATQQTVSASVAPTNDQPIAPPSGAPEALQIWREREQAALEAELAEQQAHEEAVARASQRRALRTATRQLPATESRTPGATMAGISPREIKISRPADVAAIGKLPAQPKLNANMHAAQPSPPRAPASPVDAKRSVVSQSDADSDDSEDDTRRSGAEVKTAQPTAAVPPPDAPEATAEPWRSPQAQTVSATLQQSALNATAAQMLAPDEEDLGLAHLLNTDSSNTHSADADAAGAESLAEPQQAQQPTPAAWATTMPQPQQQQPSEEDEDLGAAFSRLFDQDAEEPLGDVPQNPQAQQPSPIQPEPQPPKPQQQAKQPKRSQPVVRRPGSMWDVHADPANPDLDDDVVDEDDDLGSAFANLFDENPDEPQAEEFQAEEFQAEEFQAEEFQAEEFQADEPETDASPKPQAQQPQPTRPEVQSPKPQPQAQQPKRNQPVVQRPGSMWGADADPANPDFDDDVVDEDDDLGSGFAKLFDENPDEPQPGLTPADLTQVDEPQVDEPQADEFQTDEPEPDAPHAPQVQQPKRIQPVLRRPGSMWDADADPANADFDDDVVEEDDELGSAFANLFDENPDEPQIQPQQPAPPRTVPAWDEEDVAGTAEPDDDDLAQSFARLFDEDGTPPLAPQQPVPTESPHSIAAPAEQEQDEDGEDTLGLDGLFDEGTDASPPPAPVQPPPGWRATPPSTRSTGVVEQRQLVLPRSTTSTAVLDAPPRQGTKRAVALTLAHTRSTSIAMPELLTSQRATGWMTTTRALTTGFAASQLIQPASMPETGTTGGAFIRDPGTPAADQAVDQPIDQAVDQPDDRPPDAESKTISAAAPAAVPDIVRQTAAPPRMSVRELIAHFNRGSAPTEGNAERAAGPLANLPRALTVAPPRISVQPDQSAAVEPETVAPTASAVPAATRPASTPAASMSPKDAAFAAMASQILGPQTTPAGPRPALPAPIGGPPVSPQTTTGAVTRRRRGDTAAPPAQAQQAAFPELSHGTQAERLDALVDRVVERIEQRVIDELERRGRRHSRGVF